MPLYEFICTTCDHEYESLASYDPEGEYPGVVCPKCGTQDKRRVPSCFGFNFSNPVGTGKWENSHNYRFHHNAPKVAAERENAAARSHVGANPYPEIDDISSGANFGDVQ